MIQGYFVVDLPDKNRTTYDKEKGKDELKKIIFYY